MLNMVMLEISRLISNLISTNLIGLQLRWRCRGSGSLVVSLSDGRVEILRLNEGEFAVVDSGWHAHDYEPWIAAWDYWDTNVVWTGAWEISCNDEDTHTHAHMYIYPRKDQTLLMDGVAHFAFLFSHSLTHYLRASGGDDCKLKTWDTRQAGPTAVNKK